MQECEGILFGFFGVVFLHFSLFLAHLSHSYAPTQRIPCSWWGGMGCAGPYLHGKEKDHVFHTSDNYSRLAYPKELCTTNFEVAVVE